MSATGKFTLILGIAVMLVGCSSFANQPVSFTEVAKGNSASDYPTFTYVVIQTPEAFRNLWGKLNRYKIPTPPIPNIDFTRYTLVAIFSGEKPSGGYAFTVDWVKKGQKDLQIHISDKAPIAGDLTISVITYPYQIIQIPKTELPITIEKS